MFGTRRKVKQLSDDLERLERKFKGLELEWDDVYDKLRKAMGRVVKSRAIIDRQEEETSKGTAEQPVQTQDTPTTHGLLTLRQREIQQQILRRRAGG